MVLDPKMALWKPGAKLISIPKASIVDELYGPNWPTIHVVERWLQLSDGQYLKEVRHNGILVEAISAYQIPFVWIPQTSEQYFTRWQ